jgi:copper homeostasis protein
MVRPRAGGFLYDENDVAIMLADAEIFLKHGAAGISFGFLHADGTIDAHRCRSMINVTRKRESVFHRAFDVTPDPAAALETLIDLGVTRVMTSGQKATALEGAGLIATLVKQARGRIEVLPAGGIRPHNVRELVTATGCTQVHASLRKVREDPSVRANMGLRYSMEKNKPEDEYDGTDAAMVCAMRTSLG